MTESAFLKTIRSGRVPTPEEQIDFMRDFHARSPRSTSESWGLLRTQDGKSTYEVLLDVLPPHATTILDIGCGEGPLLALAAKRLGPGGQVCGVDVCDKDLKLARAALGDYPADLRCEPAQTLSFADHSIDAVFCHMVIALLNPLPPVLAQITRVLKPGGRFAFLTPDISQATPPFSDALKCFAAIAQEECPNFQGQVFTSPEMKQDPTLATALRATGGFSTPPQIYSFTAELKGTPAELAGHFPHFFYWGYSLSAERQMRLQSELTRIFERAQGGFRVPFALNVFAV